MARRPSVYFLALLVMAAACSEYDAASRPSIAATTTAGAPLPVLVVVAASDGIGVGADNPVTDAWPEVLRRDALPAGTRLVNLSVAGATVATALQRMLPAALEHRNAVVAVWLNVNDLISGVPAARYEEQLEQLVKSLRAGGTNRVVVGNTPPLDRAPAYLACQRPGGDCLVGSFALPTSGTVQQVVTAYNEAVARVAQRTGAEVVDLHGAGLAARTAGAEPAQFSGDGFHPSTAGYRSIAAAFVRVLRGS